MTEHSQSDRNADLLRHAAQTVEEVAAILALWPVAEEVQWDRAISGMGEKDETGRRSSGHHSDPTADVAADPGRLYVREVVGRCERQLAASLVSLRGVRRALERAILRWDRPEDDTYSDAAPPPAA